MNKWIQISSGRGPLECERAVFLLLDKMTTQFNTDAVDFRLLSTTAGGAKNCYRSVLISVSRDVDLSSWIGTILWQCKSPFRPMHKRSNWFVSVELYEPPEFAYFKETELKVDTMRSSGPGGQHVNTTDSAVRVTHKESGLSATASEERSQFMNKKLAITRLTQLFIKRNEEQKLQANKRLWSSHSQLERGNPTRRFKGEKFVEAAK